MASRAVGWISGGLLFLYNSIQQNMAGMARRMSMPNTGSPRMAKGVRLSERVAHTTASPARGGLVLQLEAGDKDFLTLDVLQRKKERKGKKKGKRKGKEKI